MNEKNFKLKKKAKELSTICGISKAVIIQVATICERELKEFERK
jgi:SRF-type transcription factor (DNA-binding and dimerisation domain)